MSRPATPVTRSRRLLRPPPEQRPRPRPRRRLPTDDRSRAAQATAPLPIGVGRHPSCGSHDRHHRPEPPRSSSAASCSPSIAAVHDRPRRRPRARRRQPPPPPPVPHHRRTHGVWLLANIGSRLTATVSDVDGRLEAFLAPGGVLPLVFADTMVRFTAGPTTYEFSIRLPDPAFVGAAASSPEQGETTVGRVAMTPDQLRLIVALAEPVLRGDGRAATSLPSNQDVARRLGWRLTGSTASSTTSARSSPRKASAACTARRASWRPTAGRAWSSTRSRCAWSPATIWRCSTRAES